MLCSQNLQKQTKKKNKREGSTPVVMTVDPPLVTPFPRSFILDGPRGNKIQ